MSELHVLNEIAPEATIHSEATIGQWCVIGPNARIEARTTLAPRVTVMGNTTIGEDNIIESGCVIGGQPQDLKFRGENTWLLIGHRNHIGRNVTLNVGTELGGYVTYLGNDNILEDACHVAHDCFVANRVRLGRKVLLAGHIVIQDGAWVEDMTGIHHFSRIGRYAHVGPRTPVRRDVPPFTDFYSEDYYWDPPQVRGLWEAGIAAAGLDDEHEQALREALKYLFSDGQPMVTKLDELKRRWPEDATVGRLCQFCRESLSGLSGRYREQFRNCIPPEAYEYLPADLLERIEKETPCL